MSKFLNLSGGLVYHYTSLKYKSLLWKEARGELQNLLNKNISHQKPLVLIGASGGYMLERSWLNSFPSLVYNDVDPVAQFIFQRQKANRNTRYDLQNYLTAPAHIPRLFERYPDHQFLFCNLLGQLHFVIKDQKWQHSPKECLQTIKAYAPKDKTFSFHELYSWKAPSKKLANKIVTLQSQSNNNDKFLSHLEKTGKTQTVSEHISPSEFPNKLGYFIWPRTPKYLHHVEFVRI